MTYRVLAISGSLRQKSLNTALLQAAASLAPEGMIITLHPLDAIPLYNSDIKDEAALAPVNALQEAIRQADGLLLASPEYNYSFSGVLKNALDWASRPAYKSVLAKKPVGLLGASMGGVGTARAQAQLRQVLSGVIAQLFPYPEFLVGTAQQKFDDALQLTDTKTREMLSDYLNAFAAWIEQLRR